MFFLPLLVLEFLVWFINIFFFCSFCSFFVFFFFHLFIFAVRQSNKLDAKPIYGTSIIIKTRQKKKKNRQKSKKKKYMCCQKRNYYIIYVYRVYVVVAVAVADVVVVGSGNVANLPIHRFICSSVRIIKSRENAITGFGSSDSLVSVFCARGLEEEFVGGVGAGGRRREWDRSMLLMTSAA